MKAISLWPPYGSLIVAGVKTIETRSRRTNYRGRIAIHNTQSIPKSALHSAEMKEAIEVFWNHYRTSGCHLQFGSVVGTVEIVGCDLIDDFFSLDLSTAEERLGNYVHGRFAWRLANPVKFDKPIPAKGKQGIWEWNR